MTKQKVPADTVAAINALLDEIKTEHAKVKNDAALCRAMKLAPPVISKLRHGHVNLTGDMKIHIHELFGIPISYIQQKLGINTVKG